MIDIYSVSKFLSRKSEDNTCTNQNFPELCTRGELKIYQILVCLASSGNSSSVCIMLSVGALRSGVLLLFRP